MGEGTFYYRVAAANAAGAGEASNEAAITVTNPSTVPGAPEGFLAVAGNGTVTLTWSAPSNDGGSPITGYKVYRGTSEGAETLLATLGNTLTYVDNDVVNGQTYYYRVSAVNALGEGPLTGSVVAKPNVGGDGGDGTLLLAIIAIAIIATVAAVALFYLKKKNKH
jgi:predicted phage tail protein